MTYLNISKHYESCLEKHGDTPKGMDWPNEQDLTRRYEVMLEVFQRRTSYHPISLLDFGCGTSGLYTHILNNQIGNIKYYGLDISRKFIDICERKYPENTYFCLDVIRESGVMPNFDYIVMNGLFTVRHDLGYPDMLSFFQSIILEMKKFASKGMAFNVMSKHVDWERDDLFHLPFDIAVDFITKNVTKEFIIRSDYGLHEYTVYLYF